MPVFVYQKAASSGADLSCTFLLPPARFGGHVPATCPGACHSVRPNLQGLSPLQLATPLNLSKI